jgi:hypothetical protein
MSWYSATASTTSTASWYDNRYYTTIVSDFSDASNPYTTFRVNGNWPHFNFESPVEEKLLPDVLFEIPVLYKEKKKCRKKR